MTDAGQPPLKPDARAARLKAALRENLRRRKVQGRGRAEAGPPQDTQDDGPAAGRDRR